METELDIQTDAYCWLRRRYRKRGFSFARAERLAGLYFPEFRNQQLFYWNGSPEKTPQNMPRIRAERPKFPWWVRLVRGLFRLYSVLG